MHSGAERMKWKIPLLALAPLLANAALPVGDTQGTVKSVRFLTPAEDAHSFEIWFDTPVENDRWSCVATSGYVKVREDGLAMTPDGFKFILSIALAAQLSRKVLAIDGGGSDPCNNSTSAYMVD